jgi:hypothetical protein
MLVILYVSYIFQRFYTYIMYFEYERGDLDLNALYNFSRISIYKRPDDCTQLEPKHVAVNKLIKTGIACDRFGTCTCDK